MCDSKGCRYDMSAHPRQKASSHPCCTGFAQSCQHTLTMRLAAETRARVSHHRIKHNAVLSVRQPKSRQAVAMNSTIATGVRSAVAVPIKELKFETDRNGLERVAYDRAGWNFWDWQGHKVHWTVAGSEDAPPLILVHGYGASAYHWRYNIPALAKKYRVFAVCLLGFGWSTKARVDYSNGRQWIAQISEFVEQIVGGTPVVLAGNSLGGYASLATAAARPDLVRGVALLNGAGPFQDPLKPVVDIDAPLSFRDRLTFTMMGVVKRVALFFAFMQAKQPTRIREVLEMVYVDKQQIDDDLIDSIVQPATDPAAPEVFFRLNHSTKPPLTVNVLLSRLQTPLLLLWGMKDPWIVPARADRIREIHTPATFVAVPEGGHCPHDDCPVPVNEALIQWIDTLPPSVTPKDDSLTAVAARIRMTN